MRLRGASSTAVRNVVAGTAQPACWLGAANSALYLMTRGSTVVAVVTSDAVRLPCAIVLPECSAEVNLARLVPSIESTDFAVTVGDGRVDWTGPAGQVTVTAVREWAPVTLPTGSPRSRAVEELRRTLDSFEACVDIGVEQARVAALAGAADTSAQVAAALALLGRGPGLTPSGDDVLSGFLIGLLSFGWPTGDVEQAIAAAASRMTTALSAQLLRHAARGECLPQLADVLRLVIGQPAPSDSVPRLLAVGHTSGSALAYGLLAATTCANRLTCARGPS